MALPLRRITSDEFAFSTELPEQWRAGLPAALTALFGDRAQRLVWVNAVGGMTFSFASGLGAAYVKWMPAPHDFSGEVARLAWLADLAVVPPVLGHGSDGQGSWLVTASLPGDSAVSKRWRSAPEVVVPVIGSALRRLHDTLPVGECPFDWSADRRRSEAVRPVPPPPAVDRLVVCHGDACSPNTLISEGGSFAGHVDLGLLGVADRWADLAIAARSTVWNYGPGWEDALLAAYGVDRDEERMRYYETLWDAEE